MANIVVVANIFAVLLPFCLFLKTSFFSPLTEIKFPTYASSISFLSSGLTEGLLPGSKILDEKPIVAATEEEVTDRAQAIEDTAQVRALAQEFFNFS